ncbi:helix-turn-helix domain-containing protein [Lactococcus hircilactis]|uniref:Helix-turn-helix domain-containing protein n=2 Tax=Lactococcus hircilactis TaxID=1494462 RepID=A0A7X1Z8A9_9LACT|nr:helix-turn-helix domain-containing protein [Lactococcus hircilactis]
MKEGCQMTFGENLKQARIKSQFTQEDVAKKCFVTRQTVSRWETDRTLPNLYLLKDLSELYNCSADELMQALVTPKQKSFFKINREYIQNMMKINTFWFFFFQFSFFIWLFCLWGLLFWGITYSVIQLYFNLTIIGIALFLFFIFLSVVLYFISLWTLRTIRIKKEVK